MMRLLGVKTHNLKDLSLELPLGALICITGPSGSGKSSLAFDTLCQEARRRYFEALSLTESALPIIPPPPLREASGLPPALGLEQKLKRLGPRSTLGTLAGIFDFLRVLFAELGKIQCPRCREEARPRSLAQILEELKTLPEGARLYVLSPFQNREKEAFRYLVGEGFSRFLIDGQLIDLLEEDLPSRFKEAYVLVDRLVFSSKALSRLEEALRLAGELSGGLIKIFLLEEQEFLSFTLSWNCPRCGQPWPEVRPELFSFNHSYGACPTCRGQGEIEGQICPACSGKRLRKEAAWVRLAGASWFEVASFPLREFSSWLEGLSFRGFEGQILNGLRAEIRRRLDPLLELGLERLNLLWPGPWLSTGERQRVRLAAFLGLSLSGALFVLDEPSLGLSPAEKEKVLFFLRQLVSQGNTVVIVEHDPLFITASDLVLELGPGAGQRGGHLLFLGPPETLAQRGDLPTGAFLSGKTKISRPKRKIEKTFPLEGVAFPRKALVVVCGPSGAGKSRFLSRLAEKLPAAALVSPAEGKGAASLVISFIGVFKAFRELLASTKEARLLGLKAKHFSPFTREGRCRVCQGRGETVVEIPFLPPMRKPCEECQGSGLAREALKVKYRGYHPHELLRLTVEEALSLFARHPQIKEGLLLLEEVGLGYLRLGQNLKSLSGGERQRLQLARFLRDKKARFLLFDLPTLGLHLQDVARLLSLFDRLLEEEKTVIVADNHPALVLSADFLLEIEENQVVFAGTLEEWSERSSFARLFEKYRSLVS